VVDGLCSVPQPRFIFDVEAGSAAQQPDEVNLLGGGSYYGWPTQRPSAVAPLAELPSADRAPGGCAIQGDRLWVTSLDGEALLVARLQAGALGPHIGSFSAGLVHRYGRLRTVVAAPDGALWLTTSNRDGHGQPIPDDERVIRIIPASAAGSSNL
jgi:glucose/arabinose dehydrogenase